MFDEADLDYHADRARAEAVRAISSDHEGAAAIHQELCLHYCGRVIGALIGSALTREASGR